jgi:hypothetical protein
VDGQRPPGPEEDGPEKALPACLCRPDSEGLLRLASSEIIDANFGFLVDPKWE